MTPEQNIVRDALNRALLDVIAAFGLNGNELTINIRADSSGNVNAEGERVFSLDLTH